MYIPLFNCSLESFPLSSKKPAVSPEKTWTMQHCYHQSSAQITVSGCPKHLIYWELVTCTIVHVLVAKKMPASYDRFFILILPPLGCIGHTTTSNLQMQMWLGCPTD
jgi:hypothetical protein